MSKGSLLSCALAVVATLLVAGVSTHAAPRESDDVKQARLHWRHGQDAYQAGKFQEALREFEAGYALVARPAFLLDMGHAARHLGELRKARGLFKRYLVAEPDSPRAAEVEALVRDLDAQLAGDAVGKAVGGPAPLPGVKNAVGAPVLVAAPSEARGEPAVPFYGRWWFWTVLAGVAAAGAATALMLRDEDASGPTPSLGTIGGP